jgi:hypothetical protein
MRLLIEAVLVGAAFYLGRLVQWIKDARGTMGNVRQRRR